MESSLRGEGAGGSLVKDSWASHAHNKSEKTIPTMTKIIPWGEKLHEKKTEFYLTQKILANIPKYEPHTCTVSKSVHACSHRRRRPLPDNNEPPGPQLHHERERREKRMRREKEIRKSHLGSPLSPRTPPIYNGAWPIIYLLYLFKIIILNYLG